MKKSYLKKVQVPSEVKDKSGFSKCSDEVLKIKKHAQYMGLTFEQAKHDLKRKEKKS